MRGQVYMVGQVQVLFLPETIIVVMTSNRVVSRKVLAFYQGHDPPGG